MNTKPDDVIDIDRKMLNKNPVEPVYEDGNIMDVLTHKDLFTAKDCAEVIKQFSPVKWNEEIVDSLYQYSSSFILADDNGLPLYERIMAVASAANDMQYHFHIDYIISVKLVKFETGDFSQINYEVGPGLAGNRKLYIVIKLSSTLDYKDGNLVVPHSGFTASRKIGSVTILPAFVANEVETVTKGTQYMLVAWVGGITRFK